MVDFNPKALLKRTLKRRLRSPGPEENERVRRLRERISLLSKSEPKDRSPNEDKEWFENRLRLRHLILTDEPRRFLEWDVIKNTMFVANPPYIKKELTELKRSVEWKQRWAGAIREDHAGLPVRSRYDLRTSGNLIHHAYSLFRFEEAIGRRISTFRRIIEFGGGYGSFARLVFRLGFRGTYLIVDLPEFLALQQFFLESVNVPIASNQSDKGVHFVSEIRPLGDAVSRDSNWLFIALWSISETPISFRGQILDQHGFNACCIAYQDSFKGIDNRQYFEAWSKARPDMKWSSQLIDHLPGNRYLFGRRR